MTCAVNRLPPKIKRYLVGAELAWSDKNPLDGAMDDELLFAFDTKTSVVVDALLRRHGVWDPSHVINAMLRWEVHMELVYSTPNHPEKSHHIDHHWFEFRGPIFPTSETFKQERERFYMLNNLEHAGVPDGHKNKGYYCLTKFTAKVVGV